MENFSLRVPLASHSNATNSLGLLVELFVVHLDDGTWVTRAVLTMGAQDFTANTAFCRRLV